MSKSDCANKRSKDPRTDCALPNERSKYLKVIFKAKDASACLEYYYVFRQEASSERGTNFQDKEQEQHIILIQLVRALPRADCQEQIAQLRVDCKHRLPRWTSQMQIDELGQMQIDEPRPDDEPSQMQIQFDVSDAVIMSPIAQARVWRWGGVRGPDMALHYMLI